MATDENGFDTCTWYTDVNADGSYVNMHNTDFVLIRNARVAKGTCPTLDQ